MGGRISAVQFSLQAAPQDTINASISPSVINISADADGHPLAAALYQSIIATMYKGKTAVNDAKIIKVNGTTTTPQTVGGVSILFSPNQNAVYSYTTGSTVSSASVEVVVYSATLNAERTVTLSVVATRKGSQGIQGLSNAVLVRRGKFTGAELDALTIVNSADRVDYIYYRPNSSSPWQKYRLKTNIASWDSTGYTNSAGNKTTTVSPFRPDSDNYNTSTSSVCWVKFNQLNDISTNFIIADAVSAESANVIEAFIGATKEGVTENEDGTFTLTNEACGWAIKAGKIYHTQSGLTLTKDGFLNDPDGLHFRVGGKLSANDNLLFNAYLQKLLAGVNVIEEVPGLTDATIEVIKGTSVFGNSMLHINAVNSSIEDIATVETTFMGGYERSKGIKVPQSGKYSFSILANYQSDDDRDLTNVFIDIYSCANENMQNGTRIARLSLQNGLNLYENFTMPASRLYFGWKIVCEVGYESELDVYVDAVKLENDTAATAINETSLRTTLLPTGIDIVEQAINLIANQFNCFNNSGEKTAFLDESGNFTIAGVMNNMINTLVQSNYNRYGSYDEDHNVLYLNPLKCPPYLDFYIVEGEDISSLELDLPSCFYNKSTSSVSLPVKTVDDEGNVTSRFTIAEMRQMVGKRLIIMPKFAGESAPELHCDLMFMKSYHYSNDWYDLGYKPNAQATAKLDIQIGEWTEAYTKLQKINTFAFNGDQSRVYYAECKTGLFKNHECIYWELEEIGAALT